MKLWSLYTKARLYDLVANGFLWNNSVSMRTKPVIQLIVCFLAFSSMATVAQTTDDAQSEMNQAESYRLFLLGRHFESQGNTNSAIRFYREAAELDKESGEILAALAGLYLDRSLWQESTATAKEALKRDPDNLTAHGILGRIYANRVLSRQSTDQDTPLAIQHLEQARRSVVPDFDIELLLARIYLSSNYADKAIMLLEELLKDELGFSEAGLLLSYAYDEVGRIPEAVTTLESVVRDGRPSFRALRRLGELYERDGRWSDAAHAYERAVVRNPRSAGARRDLAYALLQSGQTEEARLAINELIKIRPNDVTGLYLLSEVELELGNLNSAERAARILIETQPDDLRGAIALSEVFTRRRHHQEVIDVLESTWLAARRQSLQPNQVANLLGRVGYAYEQLQDIESSIRIYKQAVELMPNSLVFGSRLVQAYLEGGRFVDAQQVLDVMQLNHPSSLTVVGLQARVFGSKGDIDEGVNVLKLAVDKNTDKPTAYLTLAGFYVDHDRFKEAIDLLESVQERFPNELSILFQLGAALEQSQRFSDAERAFKRVLILDPKHAVTLNYLGYMLADRSVRLEESVGLLERAIEIDPHNGAYLDSLGWAYFKLDRLDLAETLLKEASLQMAWNSVVQDHFGDLLFKIGHYEDAIAAWERALAGDIEEVEPATIERKIGEAQRQLVR
jgi:tetratricopeptide (TPR) repeat protein